MTRNKSNRGDGWRKEGQGFAASVTSDRNFPSLYAPHSQDKVFTAALAAYQQGIDHYTNRIAHELAMLDNQNGALPDPAERL
jgi:hypothetical protein